MTIKVQLKREVNGVMQQVNPITSEECVILSDGKKLNEVIDFATTAEDFVNEAIAIEENLVDRVESIENRIVSEFEEQNSQITTGLSNIKTIEQNISNKVDTEVAKVNAQLSQEIFVERQRINNFAKLEEGSTTGDAELVDARTGMDGTIYDNVGSAIRSQITSVKKDVDDITLTEKSINIIDRDSKKNQIQGYIQADGTVRPYETLWCTDFCEIDEEKFYGLSYFVDSYCAFYSDSNELISSGKPSDFREHVNNFIVLTPPSNSKYVRLTYQPDNVGKINVLELDSVEQINQYSATYIYDYYSIKKIKDIDEIKKDLSEIKEELNTGKNLNVSIFKRGNLFDISKITNGYIQADGTVRPYETLWCTDFCEIETGSNELFCFGVNYNNYYAFYDENKSFLSNQTTSPMSIYTAKIYKITNIPSNAKYFRCTIPKNPTLLDECDEIWISNYAEKPYEDDSYVIEDLYPSILKPANPCDYSELTVSVFNKCLCIGDSLTYGGFNMDDNAGSTGVIPDKHEQSVKYSYPSQFKKITGVDTTNKGMSGLTTVGWFDTYGEEDLSGHDMCIIFLGVNDGAFSVSDEDTTLYLNKIIDKVKNENKHIKIYLTTIVPAYNSPVYLHKNEVIKEVANSRDDVVLLDIAKYGHARAYTSYTAGHLSALGYYTLAKDLARYISWHIDNNLREYRFIQFIGTDGEYTKD